MRRRSILAFLALAGGLTGSSLAQTLHAIGGVQPIDLTDNGLSFIGTQSLSTPCTAATNIVRVNLGSPITVGALGSGQTNIVKANSDGTVAVGSVANGTSIVLNPASTTATIANIWTGGATWTALANAKFPTVAAAPGVAPTQQGNCSGSAVTAYDVSGDGTVIAGSSWIFGGPSTTTGTANGCWASGAFVYDRVNNVFTDLSNAPTINATTPITYTAGASTRVNALSNDGTVAAGWDTESGGARMPVVWYKNGATWNKVFLNTLGAPSRGGEASAINASGTIIVGTSFDFPGQLVRWDRGATAATWTQTPLGAPADQPTWFTGTGFSALRISTNGAFGPTSVSDDGSIITGFANYRNGSSVAQFGLIWRTGFTAPVDVRDYLTTIPSLASSIARLPVENYGTAYVSADSSSVAFAGPGFVIAQGLVPTVLRVSDPATYAPVVTVQPCNATVNNCSSLLSPTLRAAFSGTVDASWTVRWYKRGPLNDGSDDVALTDTDTSQFQNGTGFSGTATASLRIGNASASEFGNYYCRATNAAGSVQTNIVAVAGPTVAANTLCTSAAAVSGTLPITQTVNFCAAYGSDGVLTCGSPSTTYTQLWYSFTPVTSGDYRISGCSVAATNVISIYADCDSTGSPIACSTGSNNSTLCSGTSTKGLIDRVTMSAGTTYLIRVAPRSATAPFDGSGSFSIALAPAAPANDACSAATTAVVGQNAFDTTNSTTDGTATCAVNSAGFSAKDVWFKFTPPATANYRLSTCNNTTNPSFDTALALYTGACGSLSETGCNDNFPFASGSPVLCTSTNASRFERITLQGGTEYYIRVAGMFSTSNFGQNAGNGTGSLSLALAPALPVNDECTAAINITSGTGALPFTSGTVDITEATPQDPVANPLGISCQSAARRDVWYTFTTPAVLPANPIRIQLCGQTSSIDFVMALYNGCPDSGGVEIAGGCADNIGGNGTTGCVFNAPRIDRVTLTPSTTYFVRVAGSFTSRGSAGTLTVSAAPNLPVNDDCSGATPVTVTPGAVAGATISSTAYTIDDVTSDPAFSTIINCVGDTLSTSTATSRDLFYTFTPPCSGAYTIQTCGSTQSDPILHVFSSCSATAVLACSDNVGSVSGCSFSQSRISGLALTGGVPVIIRVANTGTTRPGNVVGTLAITQADPCRICCRGTTCALTSAADCTAPAGIGTRLLPAAQVSCTGQSAIDAGCCYADFDKSGTKDVGDIFSYLSAWFALSPFSDVGGDGTGSRDVTDIFSFLSAWFAGCT